MAMSERLEQLLRFRRVPYRRLPHPPAYTARDVAHASHLPGDKMAKVVALRDETGGWLLAVVPAPRRVDLESLEFISGRHGLRLATEREIAERFPDYELGAIIPVRTISGAPIYVDDTFATASEIFFQDGSHDGLVGMKMLDYIPLARPTFGHFGHRPMAV
jgi:Ala-tRNA(Pro) deacylase